MHGAVAATEVVYYASKKLDKDAMHYEHRQQAPRGCGAIYTVQWPCVVVVIIGNPQKTESDERTGDSMIRLVFLTLTGGE